MGQKLVPPMGVRRPYKFSYYGCVLKYGIPPIGNFNRENDDI